MFYGGQLYTNPALTSAPKQTKANRAKDLATLSSLKILAKAEELKTKDSLAIPKHLSKGEVTAVKDVVQKNEFLWVEFGYQQSNRNIVLQSHSPIFALLIPSSASFLCPHHIIVKLWYKLPNSTFVVVI